jgi:hypothetical protein
MSKSRNGAIWVAVYISVFCLTSGIVHGIECAQPKPVEIEGKQLSQSVDPRGDNWIREELSERGWTREQLEAKDREFRSRSKGLTGCE